MSEKFGVPQMPANDNGYENVEDLYTKTGVELIEAKLGRPMNEANFSDIVTATNALHQAFQREADAADGVLSMKVIEALEEISFIRKIYEPLAKAQAEAQAVYQKSFTRLKDVPLPDFVANDNGQQKIAA